MEWIPPTNTSNGTPDQTKTGDHIFMKILPEMYIGIRKKSPLQFGSHPYNADPAKHQHMLAPVQIIFLLLILEMWLSMTVDFLNIPATAVRWRYLSSTECPSSYQYHYLCQEILFLSAFVCLLVCQQFYA